MRLNHVGLKYWLYWQEAELLALTDNYFNSHITGITIGYITIHILFQMFNIISPVLSCKEWYLVLLFK